MTVGELADKIKEIERLEKDLMVSKTQLLDHEIKSKQFLIDLYRSERIGGYVCNEGDYEDTY